MKIIVNEVFIEKEDKNGGKQSLLAFLFRICSNSSLMENYIVFPRKTGKFS